MVRYARYRQGRGVPLNQIFESFFRKKSVVSREVPPKNVVFLDIFLHETILFSKPLDDTQKTVVDEFAVLFDVRFHTHTADEIQNFKLKKELGKAIWLSFKQHKGDSFQYI